MRASWLRVGVLVLTITTVAATAYFVFVQERVRAAAIDRLVRSESLSREARVTVAEVGRAQRSYVAAGQGTELGTALVASLLNDLERSLKDLSTGAMSDTARTSLDSARVQLARFRKVDGRARAYAEQNQRLMASDVIFTEVAEVETTLAAEIDKARAAEEEWHRRDQNLARRRELLSLVGCVGIGLLALLFLVPTARPEHASTAPVDRPEDLPSQAQELCFTKPPVPAVVGAAARRADLSALADLCTELGRVADSGELTRWLDRARPLLDASGIIVWLTDPAMGHLRPALSSGYSRDQLAHMGTIRASAPNATATAYRTRRPQTIAADSSSGGALVAPMLTPGDCAGVLTIELQSGGLDAEQAGAIAAILASQLAGLVVSPPPIPDIARAQGGA